ncbi:MAG: alpha/beta hydrolase, partial [Bacteroidota bacterium]
MATKIIREPYGIIHQDPSPLKDVYGGTTGVIWVECMRIRPVSSRSDSVIVFSHPIGGGAFLPIVSGLAKQGHHVIYCNPRYRGNDTALIMEKCVLDLGACIKDAKKRFGYKKVILGGWSGGGSLSLFYQEQAEKPSIQQTPAGDEVDLIGAKLVPANGILLLAAHVSRSVTMTEWMDPSILEESKPYERAIDLNIYDPNCPNQPEYDDAFVVKFRAAQIARNQRITDWVKEKLAIIRTSKNPYAEHCFCVQGTMADVRWTDPTQDPSDRPPHTCYMGDPKIANDGPVGLGRFTNLRSWLSQWSYSESQANGEKNAQNIS